jgi:acyl-CoA thioesterase II
MRKVNMSAYNKSKTPIDYRQLLYYQPLGSIPPEDYNLHACAHLYASDRNSLWVVSNALGFGDAVGTMGSLSHSVVFHVNSKELVLEEGEWWCQESWTPRSGGGRGMHESRIWDPSGVHVASSWQDGLVRRAENEKGEKQRIMWFENMERLGKIRSEGGGKEKL